MEKSIILPWMKENLDKVPSGCGVLMLRTTPVNGDIVKIEISSNLNHDLMELFNKGVTEEVKYFDWYVTNDLASAAEAKKDLIKKYHLEGIPE